MLPGMVSPFPSPLLSSVLSQCSLVSDLSVMLLPSPVGWAEHNHPSVGREHMERARTRHACEHGTVGTGTLPLHLFAAVARKIVSAGHGLSGGPEAVDALPSPGLTPGCGHRDECCKTSCHAPSPCDSQSIGAPSPVPRAGREERRQTCKESERQLTTASDESKIFRLSLF